MILGSAYAIHGNNGLVKIGCSVNPLTIIRAIETQMGGNSFDSFYTDKCSNYRQIETNAHRHFKSHRVLGEWFKIDFYEAVSFLANAELCIPTEEEIQADKSNSERLIEEHFARFRTYPTVPKDKQYDDEDHCKWCNVIEEHTTRIKSFDSDDQELHCELQSKYYDLLNERETDLCDLQLIKECYDMFISFGIKNKEEVYEEFKEIDEELGFRPNHWEHIYHKKYHTVGTSL